LHLLLLLLLSPCLAYYIYSQRQGDHVQYGVCGAVAVEEYATGVIKRHEKTQVKKENDITRLTYAEVWSGSSSGSGTGGGDGGGGILPICPSYYNKNNNNDNNNDDNNSNK